MGRTFQNANENLKTATPLLPTQNGAYFAWVSHLAAASAKFLMTSVNTAAIADAFGMATDFTGATNKPSAFASDATIGAVQAVTAAAPALNAWNLHCAAFNGNTARDISWGPAPLNTFPNNSNRNPPGINASVIGSRYDGSDSARAAMAHIGVLSRYPTALERAYLAAGQNPRGLMIVTNYYKLDPTQTPAGIETDLIGGNNLTVSGTGQSANDPVIATYMVNGPQKNLILMVGGNPAVNLGALFDNVRSAFTCSIKLLGVATQVGFPTVAQGTPSQTAVLTALGALTNGDYIQFGNTGVPTRVYIADAGTSTVIFQKPQTWATSTPVFRIPASAFAASGFPISSNVLNPSPAVVATYPQCVIRAAANANAALFEDSNVFSITVTNVAGGGIPRNRRKRRRVFVTLYSRR